MRECACHERCQRPSPRNVPEAGQVSRRKASHTGASPGVNRSGWRRRIRSHPPSTSGTGLNEVRGTRSTSVMLHHGAQDDPRRVAGGAAANLRAASHWITRSTAEGPRLGSSSRSLNNAVVRLNGGLAITLHGPSGARRSRRSPRTTRTRSSRPASRTRARRRADQTSSRSIATTRAPAAAAASVTGPVPAPISNTRSSDLTSATRRRTSDESIRKFCPRLRRR